MFPNSYKSAQSSPTGGVAGSEVIVFVPLGLDITQAVVDSNAAQAQ